MHLHCTIWPGIIFPELLHALIQLWVCFLWEHHKMEGASAHARTKKHFGVGCVARGTHGLWSVCILLNQPYFHDVMFKAMGGVHMVIYFASVAIWCPQRGHVVSIKGKKMAALATPKLHVTKSSNECLPFGNLSSTEYAQVSTYGISNEARVLANAANGSCFLSANQLRKTANETGWSLHLDICHSKNSVSDTGLGINRISEISSKRVRLFRALCSASLPF